MPHSPFPTARFFQLGYVTRDLDAAMAVMRHSYGIDDFFAFDTRTSADQHSDDVMRVALAYRGAIMIELIEPMRNSPLIYGDALLSKGIAFHHCGYLIDSDQYAGLDAAGEAAQAPIALRQEGGASGVTLAYADTRANVGHYSEFVVDNDPARAFFARVPRH